MFFFTPKSPVDPATRSWTKECYALFMSKMGSDRFEAIRIITPTDEHFPFRLDGSRRTTQSVLEKVCAYMQVDSKNVVLDLFTENDEALDDALMNILPEWRTRHSGAAGYYVQDDTADKARISIKARDLMNPVSLISTLSHELCHFILLDCWKIPGDTSTMEPMTDLLTIFLGMGIFTANSCLQYNQWEDGTREGWSMKRQGYMTQKEIGYALAEWTLLKRDPRPSWARHLCTDVKAYLKQSLKYIHHQKSREGNDSTYE